LQVAWILLFKHYWIKKIYSRGSPRTVGQPTNCCVELPLHVLLNTSTEPSDNRVCLHFGKYSTQTISHFV